MLDGKHHDSEYVKKITYARYEQELKASKNKISVLSQRERAMKKSPIVVIKKSRSRFDSFPTHSRDSKLMKEARENSPPPINYETCRIEPVKLVKNVFGSRLTESMGSYYLDGKRILLGYLIQQANEIRTKL